MALGFAWEQQGCSFVFSCVGLSTHNLGQSPHNLSEKVCQIQIHMI